MKMKLAALMLIVLVAVLTCQIYVSDVAEAQGPAGNNPFEDLLDGKREGLFAGGGVGYGTTRFTSSSSIAETSEEVKAAAANLGGVSGWLHWKLGYATSEHLAFYVTSAATNLEPSLGIMMFSQKYPGYYFNGLVGYSSFNIADPTIFNEDNLETESNLDLRSWNLGAGFGYEFRPHFMVEFTAGYSRLTIPARARRFVDYSIVGPIYEYEDYTIHFNRITLFAAFNYLFY